MTVSAFSPDGTRFTLPVTHVPGRGDRIEVAGQGSGYVQLVEWLVNVSTDAVEVRVWLQDWRPAV